jgi:hypothetical protein
LTPIGRQRRRYSADVLIVHAGNRIDASDRTEPRFPASQVAAVAQRVGRLFDVLRPAGVVSAPAAGSDLIVLDQARLRQIPLHVLMPINAEEFVRASVADHDAEWLDLYRTVLHHAGSDSRSTVCEIDKVEREHWFLDANDDLLVRAAELAGDDLVVALTVRPPAGEIPHSTSDDFADRAGKAGWIVLTVDPRPGSVTLDN